MPARKSKLQIPHGYQSKMVDRRADQREPREGGVQGGGDEAGGDALAVEECGGEGGVFLRGRESGSGEVGGELGGGVWGTSGGCEEGVCRGGGEGI